MEPGRRLLSPEPSLPHVPAFRPDPDLFPFRSRWFRARAGCVHYIDEGEGPPILFLHGNPTWSFLYRGVVVRLRDRFRCIAPDYLGFGLSEHPADFGYTPRGHAETVLQLVRHLDLEGLTIFGHDWGGPVGMRVALDALPRLRALVMGNTWYWPADSWKTRAFGYVMSSEPMQRWVVERNLLVERLIPRATRHEMAPAVLEHYRRVLPTRASRAGVAELPRHVLASSFWLGELAHAVPRMLGNVPLLLTWGIRDFAFPSRLMDRFRQDFRDVTVRRLEAKHLIQEDAPAEIADAVESFLNDRAGGP